MAQFDRQLIQDIESKAESEGVGLIGRADLRGFLPKHLNQYKFAVSMAFPMNPEIMGPVIDGPYPEYAREYGRVNTELNRICETVVRMLTQAGARALALPASVRSDPRNIKGVFPHKTAATRAGLGWVGRHCQLVTREYGPWIRLGTVLTDREMPVSEPVTRSGCGTCRACVEACPAKALTGNTWAPGIARMEILNPHKCDMFKKANYFHLHHGHNCAICTAACPFGQKYGRKLTK